MSEKTHGPVPWSGARALAPVRSAETKMARQSRPFSILPRFKEKAKHNTTLTASVPAGCPGLSRPPAGGSKSPIQSPCPDDAEVVARTGKGCPQRLTFEPGQLYTTQQVAAVTGLSAKAFEAWRLKGFGGPSYIKLGKAVRYRGDDLLAWIDANRCSSTSEN
ncbi:helix-turn-helix transcriptional regulator [Azospirillum rugosum]|uniref:DNA-binding transcriptional regulator AlpA n=1 Tax=Azospirillum rugosum TaxID=416170 RepID=A0ABS4SID7_9PROT|nr:helix-turn-helix domain-containing protein [Azospirillum rugosum]MBP2292235.1 putative DNA-binding transcriptional regulator AlpA [Azospirillum rugosum]MDQ0525994.1 putative DNA-binding transcriptional regulator AlpA [Azospirillum rugosum]